MHLLSSTTRSLKLFPPLVNQNAVAYVLCRTMASAIATRKPKEEGSISSVFASLSGEAQSALPQRFSELKKEIWNDSLVESWRDVLAELEGTVEEIAVTGTDMIPRIAYADIQKDVSVDQVGAIKKAGSVIITGGVPQQEALSWKESIRNYAAANSERVKGFPPENIQVYELYNSKAQVLARTHPAVIETQRFLLSLWHKSDSASEVSLDTPISYFDRLRIRQPGDAKFTLGPHIDGGSVERWEDTNYRSCFGRIFHGGRGWKDHDPFDATPRINANQDLYHSSNQCSIFRPWQGWTSLSSTGPNEGTLRVFPRLALSSAYVMLRPFFRPRQGFSGLKFEDWELDIDSSAFPGSGLGKAQELNEESHPHLRLDRTMISMPKVEPGDQVYWHCDVIHSVEARHQGVGNSSVLYIPAVPLTLRSANYLRDQRINFLAGLPAPDFPGGEGESKFSGRGTTNELKSIDARRMFGLEPFTTSRPSDFIDAANRILLYE